ncbi:MAG: hypothetical protein O7H40_17820, partial [Gammaproteobacteria bacterium]|nr:hypothetical protein [Gammaproteobacteria bacterium]
GNIHPIAVDSLGFNDNVANVNANAKVHFPRFRQSRISFCQFFLGRRTATDGIDGACELGQQIISR